MISVKQTANISELSTSRNSSVNSKPLLLRRDGQSVCSYMNEIFHGKQNIEDTTQLFKIKNKRIQLETSKATPDNLKSCSLCSFDFMTGEELATLPCGDTFHSCCLSDWLEDNRSCYHCQKIINVYYCGIQGKNVALPIQEQFDLAKQRDNNKQITIDTGSFTHNMIIEYSPEASDSVNAIKFIEKCAKEIPNVFKYHLRECIRNDFNITIYRENWSDQSMVFTRCYQGTFPNQTVPAWYKFTRRVQAI